MKARALVLAVPLALGLACTHKQQTGATSTPSDEQRQASGSQQGGAAGGGPLAQDPIMHPGPSIQGHAEDEVLIGQIASATDSSLTVETAQGDKRTLQIVPETTVELDGQDASATQLSEGQQVRASYALVDGQEIAVKIRAGDAVDPGEPARQGTGSSAEPVPAPSAAEPFPAPSAPEPLPTPSDRTNEGPAGDPGSATPDAGWGPPGAGGSSGTPPAGTQR